MMAGSPVNDCSGVQELVAPEEQEIKRAAAALRKNKLVPFRLSCSFQFMDSFKREDIPWLGREETTFL